MQTGCIGCMRTSFAVLKTALVRRQLHRSFTLHGPHLTTLFTPSTVSSQATSMYFRPPRPDIYTSFHRTTLPIVPWSTNWETCDTILFFTPSLGWYNLSDFDFYADILLEAGGEYYEIDDYSFVWYGGGFTGPDDFLRQLPHLKRLVEEFPDNEDDLYVEACREQRRLVEAAGQKLYN
ncbi:hypothetical protein B0H16DRAFT_1734198 [Mycena metata]|uniref:Uncharacterized protein n=1 Tax=Mycena metata TaxID=1033252 RepID=A0AAD7HVX5_9AGAR|nr:hypothetical protein B0H16DRAFT_1734198 [Mycena metata]